MGGMEANEGREDLEGLEGVTLLTHYTMALLLPKGRAVPACPAPRIAAQAEQIGEAGEHRDPAGAITKRAQTTHHFPAACEKMESRSNVTPMVPLTSFSLISSVRFAAVKEIGIFTPAPFTGTVNFA